MKNILESGEVFEAYAVIDFCYFELQEIGKELSKPQHALEIMIDNSTGYREARNKELTETSISLLEQVIENKKIVEADYSGDLKTLNKLKELTNNPTINQ